MGLHVELGQVIPIARNAPSKSGRKAIVAYLAMVVTIF
jgi:hypothetical protein